MKFLWTDPFLGEIREKKSGGGTPLKTNMTLENPHV